MANFAALIAPLSIGGSRLSDGSVNASGKCWFFQPGGNTPVSVYKDAATSAIVTAPVTLTAGGLLNRTDFPDGIFATQPIRLLIQDASGNTVSDTVYIPATAGNVGVSNAGFTDSTLDDVLDDAFTSFGGQDWKYKESGGATSRTVKEKFAEIWISVKDFGAVGDGVAIDATAVQAAASRALALGGAIVYFPPGTYLIDQAIALTSAVGVTYLGVRGATIIKTNHATANVFTFATASTACAVEGMTFQHTGTTTGAAIAAAAATNFAVRNVLVFTGDFTTGISVTGASDWTVENCNIYAITTGISSNISLTAYPNILSNTDVSGATAALTLTGAGSNYGVFGGLMSGAGAGILFSAFTGTNVKVFGCRNTAATAYDMSALATNPAFEQYSNNVDGYTVDVASGGTVTPNLARGNHIRIRGTSTGVAFVVAAPTPVPPSSTTQGLYLLYLSFFNNAGGAVTGWSTAATYHLSGTGPSTTDLEKTNYTLVWEGDLGVWREVSRSVTT